jgi:hypothetical protein
MFNYKLNLKSISQSIIDFFVHLINDKDLLNTSLNQGFKIIAGPLLLVFIPLFLSPEIQGYWFSFISLSALSVLADLGFTIIIMQYSAHEFAFLKVENNILVPIHPKDRIHLEKLSSLLKFSINWVSKIIIIAFPIILTIGFLFFNSDGGEIEWRLPWIIYTFGAALNFVNYLILSFLEGCNNLAITQRFRFYNILINYCFIFLLLYLGANLYALAISILISSILTVIIIFLRFKSILKQLWNISITANYNWSTEFWLFFKKYSVSVASGFLVVQIFTPLSFIFYGAISAGKVGLTMGICTAIFSLSQIWFISISPRVNILTSQKKWELVNKLLNERQALAIGTYLIGIITFCFAYFFIQNSIFFELTNRLLPLLGIVILLVSWLLQIPVYTMAMSLRAHKKEPYTLLSVVSSIIVVILTLLIVNYLPEQFIFSGLLISIVFTFPFALSIYRKKKSEWCV